MAYDKVVDSAALDEIFTDIADAIRTKSGATDAIDYTDMATAINALSGSDVEMITVSGIISKGSTYYYFDENKQVQTITGTSIKGDPYEISAYGGLVFTRYDGGLIYGQSGSFINIGNGGGIIALSDGVVTSNLASTNDALDV